MAVIFSPSIINVLDCMLVKYMGCQNIYWAKGTFSPGLVIFRGEEN